MFWNVAEMAEGKTPARTRRGEGYDSRDWRKILNNRWFSFF